MRKLYRHPLNYELAYKYAVEALDETNLLSVEFLKYIKNKGGEFFTLLPNDADLSRLYIFNSFILKQNPMVEYGDEPKKSTYQLIPTIREELCDLLISEHKRNENLISVFDDFNSTYKDGYSDEIFNSHGIHYNEEIYYFLNSENISKDLLLECFRISNTFWHSIYILSEAKLEDIPEKKLTLEKAQEICLKARFAMIGAYDGEGYVFWEPLN